MASTWEPCAVNILEWSHDVLHDLHASRTKSSPRIDAARKVFGVEGLHGAILPYLPAHQFVSVQLTAFIQRKEKEPPRICKACDVHRYNRVGATAGLNTLVAFQGLEV